MRRSLIVARARNGVIGRDNALPWRLPADLAFFKRTTMGATIVMGRRTWQSIGRPLPGRRNIVVSRTLTDVPPDVIVVPDLDSAFAAAAPADEAFVIGGAQLYADALVTADRIYVTEVDADIEGDTHFPSIDAAAWDVTPVGEHPADERHAWPLQFLRLDRRAIKETVMSIAQSMLPEFDHEFATLRKILERVPDGKNDFAPHAKSMKMGQLAGHLAELPGWVNATVEQDELDFAKMAYKPFIPANTAELVAALDKALEKARPALAGTSDADMMKPWTLRQGEQVFFTMPKVAVLRSFVMNHMIHHRAQLGVYLRMNDVPLPGSYGPSADEGNM